MNHPLMHIHEWMVANRIQTIQLDSKPGHLSMRLLWRQKRIVRLPGQGPTIKVESTCCLPTKALCDMSPEEVDGAVLLEFKRMPKHCECGNELGPDDYDGMCAECR